MSRRAAVFSEDVKAQATYVRQWHNKGVRNVERRFSRATETGTEPDAYPGHGPCLNYLGADNGNGYGQFSHPGGQYAHRYAWERTNGPIPKGMTVDHLCRNRRCCNVDHLELVTRTENYLRAVRLRDHCRNGHPYKRKYDGTSRVCEVCRKESAKRGGERRTRKGQGLPDRRVKYDQDEFMAWVKRAAAREVPVSVAAREFGCSAKYMDKRVRRFRREGR